MPIQKVGANCFRWGNSGKIYCGKGAQAKAAKQGKAAFANGYKGKKK